MTTQQELSLLMQCKLHQLLSKFFGLTSTELILVFCVKYIHGNSGETGICVLIYDLVKFVVKHSCINNITDILVMKAAGTQIAHS